MRILYGIQGTGNGHTTRARVMAKAFRNYDVEVDYLFSGREPNDYFDMEVFTGYQTRRGLTFVTEHGQVNIWKTIKNARLKEFYSDIRNLDVSKYDLVFNDFEPISAWAAKLAAKPVIAMSHQASFLCEQVPVMGANFMTRNMIRYFAPANVHLGVHWQPFSQNIIPPFIESHFGGESLSAVNNKILVYLPFENLLQVKQFLLGFPEFEFYCYHPRAERESINNVHLFPPSREGFLSDLSNAAGVVANAGFELSSESLTFGKKLLLKPLSGQFEQLSNATALEEMGWAKVMGFLDPEVMSEWLTDKGERKISFPADPTPLIDWLLARQWDKLTHLTEALWSGVKIEAA